MNVLIKILPQEFIKNHFRTSIFSLDMLLKSSKSCFYNRGPNSQTLVGFGNFPKFKNLSQILLQNPRNWEYSQSLTTLHFCLCVTVVVFHLWWRLGEIGRIEWTEIFYASCKTSLPEFRYKVVQVILYFDNFSFFQMLFVTWICIWKKFM